MTSLCWAVSSSSGRERLEFSVSETLPLGRAVVSVTLLRDFWKREIKLAGSDVVTDVRLELPQVVSDTRELRLLLSCWESWLDDRTHFEQSIEANGIGDQYLRISVGQSSAFIYTQEKPTLTIAAGFGGYFFAESSFVVDESCIRLARDSLAELLRSIDA